MPHIHFNTEVNGALRPCSAVGWSLKAQKAEKNVSCIVYEVDEVDDVAINWNSESKEKAMAPNWD